MKHIPVSLFIILMFFACKNEPAKPKTEPSPPKPQLTVYPALSDVVRYGLTTCNKIDIIFHTLPMSMNLSESSDVLAFQQFFGQGDVELAAGCISDGTIIFQQNTLVAAEAELYLSGECKAFIFKALGKPAFGVPLTQEGKNYFDDLIARVQVNKKENN